MVRCSVTGSDGATTDITEICGNWTLKGASKECARTLDIEVVKENADYFLPSVVIKRGDMLVLTEESDGKSSTIYEGVVWDREYDDNEAMRRLTCYDKAVYLNKNSTQEQVFTDMTPPEITTKICDELGLSVGELAPGEKMTINARGAKAYDAIMMAYTKESATSGKKYKLVCIGDKISVLEAGKQHPIVLEELEEMRPGKLLSMKYSDTLDDVTNVVSLTKEKELDEQEEVSEGSSQSEVGTLQMEALGTKQDAKALLSPLKKSCSVKVVADYEMFAGMSVYLKSSLVVDGALLEDEFFIIDENHEFEDGLHVATLKLSTEFEMDSKSEAADPAASGTHAGDYTGGGYANPDMEKLKAVINSRGTNAFTGKEAFIVAMCEKYGVPASLMVAIFMFETGYGRSSAVRNKNNPAGIMTSGGKTVKSFATLEEGIEAAIANLAKYPSRYGVKLTDIDAVAKIYCPVGAKNDKHGTNHLWPSNIKRIVNELGGMNAKPAHIQQSGGAQGGASGGNALRQAVRAAAYSMNGWDYSQGSRMSYGKADCSSFVDRAVMKAMNITPKKGYWSPVTVTNQMKNWKWVEIPMSQVRPWDILWRHGHTEFLGDDGRTFGAHKPGTPAGPGSRFSPKNWTKAYRVVGT